jgi:putative ABC transport system ATP-binding protein
MSEAASVLRFDSVSMSFPTGGHAGRRVLQDVDFSLAAGEAVALVGRSGSGKSTLLHLAAGISVPTAGRVLLAGRDLGSATESERTGLRGSNVGLVFQFFHLLPHLSVHENVALPGWVAGESRLDTDVRVIELLDRVALADRAGDPVAKLSGGEMQRVAICRALLRSPPLVLADEPTGSLDDTTGRQVMDLLLELVRAENSTLLYVTHSRELARLADFSWRLHDGLLETGVST